MAVVSSSDSIVVGEGAPGLGRKRWVYLAILLMVVLGTRLFELDGLPYGHNNDDTGLAYEGYLLLQESDYEVFVSQARESTLPYLCGTTRLLPIEWPDDIVAGDDQKIVLATQPRSVDAAMPRDR